jgi:catalase
MDMYAQQHTVDGYRFELGNVANMSVVQNFIDVQLNSIDNCLARRVAYGVGATMPAMQSNNSTANGTTPTYASLYELNEQSMNKSNAGLSVAVLANDTVFSEADMTAMMPILQSQQVSLAVVGPYMGTLQTGVNATANYITSSSVLYDAVFIGDTNGTDLSSDAMAFVMQAYKHGKPIGALGSNGDMVFMSMGLGGMNASLGLYAGDAGTVTQSSLRGLSFPSRFFNRFPIDDVETICGSATGSG